MLIDNINYLRLRNRHLLQKLNEVSLYDKHVDVELSKSGELTMRVKHDDSYKYVHSKYNPIREIDKLVDNFDLPENKSHILLFGLGMGYHYTSLKKKFPKATFSIYEPSITVLKEILSHISLEELFQNEYVTLMVNETIEFDLQSLLQKHKNQIEVFVLPFYQKNYRDQLDELFLLLLDQLKSKKSNLATSLSFQKRWTINAIKNLPTILKTPNILKDIDKELFNNKPAIIISAGPSLNEEIENLKYIKKQKLAYIFSVGSAINTLVENKILPDAICTYDPQAHNYKVIQKVKDKKIDTIPLIFGSTVGYETLYNYEGPLLHMITSQDTISPYLLRNEEGLDVVNDAPSIALITYQMLVKLGFKTIYLVGQNLSFKDRYRYASGVEYGTEQVSEDRLISVKSVDGGEVWTDDGYNRMRERLEDYIKMTPDVKVYNTTKNGAAIDGATFIVLSEVIENHFLEDNLISNNWYSVEADYLTNDVVKYMSRLEKYQREFEEAISEITQMIEDINHSKHQYQKNSGKLESKLARFDKKFKRLQKNQYNRFLLLPMLRVQLATLSDASQKIKEIIDPVEKTDLFYNQFGSYLYQLNHLSLEVNEYFVELKENIEREVKS